MLYILYGEDDYSLNRSLDEIKRDIGDPAMLAANTTVLEGQKLTLEQLRGVCEAVPFLTEKRLVIVRGLLERFEARAKTGRAKNGATAARDQEWRPFAEYLGKVPLTTVLVFTDGKIRGQNPLLVAAAGKAKALSFPLLREAQLQQWVQKRVKESGGSISSAAVGLLVRFVGSDLWLMGQEVDKLVLFAAGRSIEEEDIRQMVSNAQEASVFTMVDAILESRLGAAEQLLQQLLQQGAPPPFLLMMLARQVGLILRVKELKAHGKPEKVIQEKLKLSSDFVVRKAAEQAERLSPARLKEVYHRLLETDLSIKTGKYDAELALSMLIAELCLRR